MSPSLIYDILFREASKLFAPEVSPCKWEGGRCAGMRSGHEPSACCGGCPNLGPTGCTVQALWCRLWTCHSVETDEHHKKQVERISRIAQKLDLLHYRASKEEAFSRRASKRRRFERFILDGSKVIQCVLQ